MTIDNSKIHVHSALCAERKISYWTFGEITPDKKILVMLHGRGSNSAQFWDIAGHVANDTRTVIVIDLPGHGDSDALLNWSLNPLVESLRTLIVQEIKVSRFDLFGHSLGGVIALEYTRQYPTHVRQLVVMGTHLEILSVPQYMISLDYGIRKLLGNTWLYSMYLSLVWCRGDRDTTNAFKEVWSNSGGHDVARDLAIISQIPRYDYLSSLEEFEEEGGCVNIIVCESDTFINSNLDVSLEFMNEENGRRVLHVPGGHYSHMVDPDPLVVTLIQLLK